jgi:hypothetical protein
MDLNEYLEEIAVINPKKPWAIIISQIVFDCIRKYCLDLIQESELKVRPWETIYELCENYIEESFKPYLGEIFQLEHYEQFDTEELCIAFLKKFLELLKETLDNKDSNEDTLTNFLDTNIFVYFETVLSEYKDYYIFPKDFEGVLNIQAYEGLREKLFEKKYLYSEEVDEPVVEKEEQTKSLTQALKKKRLGIKETRKINTPTSTFVFAKTHKNRKIKVEKLI